MSHQVEDIITLFSQTFFESYNTKLIRGGSEPVYLPASEQCEYHQIIFAHGFYASALHEISHWCIAGQARRLLEDFGYWYEPDGRNAQQQAEFEQVEVKPQAVEWALCAAANKTFNVSVDNLNGASSNREAFQSAVFEQVGHYLKDGFPERVNQLMTALCEFYNTSLPTSEQHFINVSPKFRTTLSVNA